jgi:hypothetical protein
LIRNDLLIAIPDGCMLCASGGARWTARRARFLNPVNPRIPGGRDDGLTTASTKSEDQCTPRPPHPAIYKACEIIRDELGSESAEE